MNDAIGWSLDRRPQKKKNVNFVVSQIFSLTLFFVVVVVVVFSLLSFSAFKITLIFSVHLLIDLDFCTDESIICRLFH